MGCLNPNQDYFAAASALFLASRTAASVRTNFELGAANVPTNFAIGALSTPNICDNACARVGNAATRSSESALSSCPPKETIVVTSLSLSLVNALTMRAAAPGSSLENARTIGPFNAGEMHSKEVPATALRASVFLTIRRYTPSLRALARRSVICVTVKPRFSAPTTDRAFAATALTSATTTFFSSNLSAIYRFPVEKRHTTDTNAAVRIHPLSNKYSSVRPSQAFLIPVPPSAQAAFKSRGASRTLLACGLRRWLREAFASHSPPNSLHALRAYRHALRATIPGADAAPSLNFDQTQTRLIDGDARTHGRGHRQLLQVHTLGSCRFDLLQIVHQRQEIFLQRARLEIRAPDLRVHDACLVGAVTHLPGLRILHRFRHIRRNGAHLRVRHEATRSQDLSELADDAHGIGAGDHHVEIDLPGLDLLGQIIETDNVGTCRFGGIRILALGEHRDAHRLAGAVRHHG